MAKEANKRPKPKVTKVTKLKVVDRVFASDGEVLIKVTRAGRVEFISLPITSDKYRQAVQRYDSQSPRPPRRPLNRDEAEEAGLPRGTLVPDLSDEGYQARLAEHNRRVAPLLAAAVLALPIIDETGKEITDDAARADALVGMGISAPQLRRIVDQGAELSEMTADEERRFC